jgi:hypothetical protein
LALLGTDTEDNDMLDREGNTITDPIDSQTLEEVRNELGRARDEHDDYNSAHEAYSVILEELEEFWAQVKRKKAKRDRVEMRNELVQIACTAVRAVSDLSL